MKKQIKITNTDYLAIEKKDCNYINNKGAALYKEDTYEQSVEYYRLAAAMGCTHSISNLGYCYLYGRGIKANLSLAIAYFKIAAKREDIDACYKLGDIYSSNKWGLKDDELAVYYYRLAASIILDDWNKEEVLWCKRLEKYPSLSFALGRELLKGENMTRDLVLSYLFLKHAYEGYEEEIMNGSDMYKEVFNKVIDCLQDNAFDPIRDRLDKEFMEAYSEDDFFDEFEDDEYEEDDFEDEEAKHAN